MTTAAKNANATARVIPVAGRKPEQTFFVYQGRQRLGSVLLYANGDFEAVNDADDSAGLFASRADAASALEKKGSAH